MIGLQCTRLSAWRRSLKITSRFVTVQPFKGRATITGTYEFIRKSKLPLHHEFAVSKLTINPIIHGAPKNYSGAGKNTEYLEALTRRAVVKNRSNCIVVYQHHDNDDPWYATNLHKLFLDPINDVKRENVVVVAHLGYATTREDILKRLSDACRVTRLEVIDMVLFEVTENTSQVMLDETIMTLQDLSRNGKLQSFGVHVSVAPYVYHNPIYKETGPLQSLPMYIEGYYVDKFKYADMVMYPISPTTSVPTTYPMLDPNSGEPDSEDEEEGVKRPSESTRKFTRIAIHPLTCKLGGKEAFKYENPAIWEARAELEAQQQEEQEANEDTDEANADGSDSADGEENRGAQKQKRELSAEKKQLLAELRKQDPSFTAEDLDSDSDVEDEKEEDGAQDSEIVQEFETALRKSADASSARDHEAGGAEAAAAEVEERELVEVDLINSLHDRPFEQIMIEALDEVCPPLKSTPLLEDKALRVVFSVGIDCVMVDAERSAMLGKLRLHPADMLTSAQTDDVFSRFCLPNPNAADDSDDE